MIASISWIAFFSTDAFAKYKIPIFKKFNVESDIRDPLVRMRSALEVLTRLPSGRAILDQARKFWNISNYKDLLTVFKWGGASRTDGVLTRRYNPKTGEETRERQITVYLKRDLTMEELVLDMAHELVHATTRPSWDPYDPALTPGKYILAAIEGQGGEVEAVSRECGVWRELSEITRLKVKRCETYLGANGQIQAFRVRQDFYRVGHWNHDLRIKLGIENQLFPLLSGESPKLYSSTGKAPYPIALLREFDELSQIACENTKKRVAALEDRKPAFASETKSDAETRKFLSERCNSKSQDQEATRPQISSN